MSNPKQPSRLAQYSDDGIFYPREIVELNGILYMINDDGTKTILNETKNTTIKDANGVTIGTVNPKTGEDVTVPNATSSKRGLSMLSDSAPKAPAATASAGTSENSSRADHVHPVQTSVSGNAGTATKLETARNIGLSGVTATAQSFDGSSNITIPITAVPASIVTGLSTVATSGSYSDLSNKPTIPSASTTTPSAPATTAVVGTASTYARADHVHPVQTSVSGNAGTATKLAESKTIGLSGVTATAQSFDGSSNITIPITDVPASIVSGLSDVVTKHQDVTIENNTATIDNTLTAGQTFKAIGGITRDSYGHVTKYNVKTITMPSNARQGNGYATCSTAEATTAKVASLTNYSLILDGSVSVRFTNAVPAGSTLNINSTGAKAIYDGSTNAAITAGRIKAGDTATFVYNGTYYYLVSTSSSSKTYTVSVGTSWTGDAAPYTQTLTLNGIEASDNPIVDVVLSSDDYNTATSELEEFAKIYRITTQSGAITVYASDITNSAINIQLKCIK